MLRLVFRPQVGHWEAATAGAASDFTRPASAPGDPDQRPRRLQIGTHSSQSRRLPALMGGRLFWRDNEMEDGENSGLLRRIRTRATAHNTDTHTQTQPLPPCGCERVSLPLRSFRRRPDVSDRRRPFKVCHYLPFVSIRTSSGLGGKLEARVQSAAAAAAKDE